MVAACDRSSGRLVVPSAVARTVRGLGPDGPRPGRRSGVFPTSHRTVCGSGTDGSRLWAGRSATWAQERCLLYVTPDGLRLWDGWSAALGRTVRDLATGSSSSSLLESRSRPLGEKILRCSGLTGHSGVPRRRGVA
jgi:hypothetical protein